MFQTEIIQELRRYMKVIEKMFLHCFTWFHISSFDTVIHFLSFKNSWMLNHYALGSFPTYPAISSLSLLSLIKHWCFLRWFLCLPSLWFLWMSCFQLQCMFLWFSDLVLSSTIIPDPWFQLSRACSYKFLFVCCYSFLNSLLSMNATPLQFNLHLLRALFSWKIKLSIPSFS